MRVRHGWVLVLLSFFSFKSSAAILPEISFEPPAREIGPCIEVIAFMAGGESIAPLSLAMGHFKGGALPFEAFQSQWEAIQKGVAGRTYAKMLLRWSHIIEDTGLMSAKRFFMSVANRKSRLGDPRARLLGILPSVPDIYDMTIDSDGEVDPTGTVNALALIDTKLNVLKHHLNGEVNLAKAARNVFDISGGEEAGYTQGNPDNADFQLQVSSSKTKGRSFFSVYRYPRVAQGGPSIPVNLEDEPLKGQPPLQWIITQDNYVIGGLMPLPPAAARLILEEVENRLASRVQ